FPKQNGLETLPLIKFHGGTWISNSDVIVGMIDKKYEGRSLATQPNFAYLGLKILPKLAAFLKTKDEKDGSKQALLYELKELDKHLSEHGPYVDGKEITAVDLSLAPKLYHLVKACLFYKNWDVLQDLKDLPNVLSYTESLFDLDSFKTTKPCEENVIEGWAPKLLISGMLSASSILLSAHDQSLDVLKPKHACLEFHSSQGDSNSFPEDADSVMSVSINDQYSTNDEISSSEGASSNNTSDYTMKQLEQDELLEVLFCSDGVVVPNSFVISSGRWNIIQGTVLDWDIELQLTIPETDVPEAEENHSKILAQEDMLRACVLDFGKVFKSTGQVEKGIKAGIHVLKCLRSCPPSLEIGSDTVLANGGNAVAEVLRPSKLCRGPRLLIFNGGG
ncbi:dehydroascorbate reductase 2, partial [Tanacetum coccineum]